MNSQKIEKLKTKYIGDGEGYAYPPTFQEMVDKINELVEADNQIAEHILELRIYLGLDGYTLISMEKLGVTYWRTPHNTMVYTTNLDQEEQALKMGYVRYTSVEEFVAQPTSESGEKIIIAQTREHTLETLEQYKQDWKDYNLKEATEDREETIEELDDKIDEALKPDRIICKRCGKEFPKIKSHTCKPSPEEAPKNVTEVLEAFDKEFKTKVDGQTAYLFSPIEVKDFLRSSITELLDLKLENRFGSWNECLKEVNKKLEGMKL